MMKKAIFYKEWIKLRWTWGLLMGVCSCFTGYALLRILRVVEFKGVAHVWEILLTKEVVFIDILKYVPLIAGILVAVVQFVPEMQQKRLKLTLHLPFPQARMIRLMLGFGLFLLLTVFVANYICLAAYLYRILAPELAGRILLTALLWYLAGVTAYFLASWICLEPAWHRRVFNLLVAAAALRVFFLSDSPQAYDPALLTLLVFVVCVAGFPWLSVRRFTLGKQD